MDISPEIGPRFVKKDKSFIRDIQNRIYTDLYIFVCKKKVICLG